MILGRNIRVRLSIGIEIGAITCRNVETLKSAFVELRNSICTYGASPATALKHPPAMQETQETWVLSLGLEDPLAKEMAIHSSILAWRIPWPEEPGRLQSTWSQRVRHK